VPAAPNAAAVTLLDDPSVTNPIAPAGTEHGIAFVAMRSLGADLSGPFWIVEAMPDAWPVHQRKRSLASCSLPEP
jgi:hypothetical protein